MNFDSSHARVLVSYFNCFEIYTVAPTVQDAIIYCVESPEYDVNVRDNAGYTPLHEACNKGHLGAAQVSIWLQVIPLQCASL